MNSFWAYDFLFFLDLSPVRVSHVITQQFSPFGEILWAEQKTINQSMLISLYHLVSELLCADAFTIVCCVLQTVHQAALIVRTMPSCGLISLLSDWKTLSQTLNSPHKRLLSSIQMTFAYTMGNMQNVVDKQPLLVIASAEPHSILQRGKREEKLRRTD